jgi:hypothetical protein
MQGGAAADNTPGDNDMAMQWIDNVFHFPNFKARDKKRTDGCTPWPMTHSTIH